MGRTDLQTFARLRTALDGAGITYKVKTINQQGEWAGRGTLRGNLGSLGVPADQMVQHEILVGKKDAGQARHLMEQTFRQP